MNFKYKLNLLSRITKSIIFNKMPNYAVIFIDGRCNMHCDFCCYAAMDARKTSTITAKEWGHIFRRSDSLLHLTVTGGEPFLRKDFVEIIGNIIKSCNVPRISIKSNGFYIKRIKEYVPELLNKFPSTEFTLSISLDGPEFLHDKVRNFKGGYSRVLETLEIMEPFRKKDNFFLRIASVLTLENKEILEKFIEETANWKIDFHEIILIRDVEDKIQLELKPTYERLSKLQHSRATKKWRNSFNGKMFEKIYFETIKRIDSKKIHSPCLAGGRFLEIFPDGLVRGCEMEKMWEVSKIGHLNTLNNNGTRKDIVDIVNSKEAKKFREVAKCCTCTFECANAINTVYDPKHWISLIPR